MEDAETEKEITTENRKDPDEDSSEIINQTLLKLARGTGIIFVGSIISMVLAFFTTPLIARYLTVSQYGIYALTLTVLSFGTTLATLGLGDAIPREISHYKEKKPHKLEELISTGFFIALSSSIIFTVIFIASGDLFAKFFGDENFTYPFMIMVLSLPFITLVSYLSAISRGYGRVREYVFFGQTARPLLFLAGVLAVILFRLDYYLIYWAYVASVLLTLIIFLSDVKKQKIFPLKMKFSGRQAKGLIKFSIPLFFTGILGYLMTWTDTLMLGYFKPSSVVGLYNAAAPPGRILPIFLYSFAFLYNPLATALYVRGRIKELKKVYQMITKWIFFLTLPIFAMFFIFPEACINFLFGSKYLSASIALQILSLGFMVHAFFGLSGLSLVVIGKPKLNLYGDVTAVILNFTLNILLIPRYGMVGAAVATASAFTITTLFRTALLYRETGIHPFGLTYLKPLIICFLLLGALKILTPPVTSIWQALIILSIFLILYFLLTLLSRSIDREDINLFLAIEKRAGMDFKMIKNLLKRFA